MHAYTFSGHIAAHRTDTKNHCRGSLYQSNLCLKTSCKTFKKHKHMEFDNWIKRLQCTWHKESSILLTYHTRQQLILTFFV